MKQASFIIDKKTIDNNINKSLSSNSVIKTQNSLTKKEPNKNLHDNNEKNNNLIISNKPRKYVENIYYF
jgi:hypothetical protein